MILRFFFFLKNRNLLRSVPRFRISKSENSDFLDFSIILINIACGTQFQSVFDYLRPESIFSVIVGSGVTLRPFFGHSTLSLLINAFYVIRLLIQPTGVLIPVCSVARQFSGYFLAVRRYKDGRRYSSNISS